VERHFFDWDLDRLWAASLYALTLLLLGTAGFLVWRAAALERASRSAGASDLR
jgi:hypothetical protein